MPEALDACLMNNMILSVVMASDENNPGGCSDSAPACNIALVLDSCNFVHMWSNTM